jgi:ATP-dependent DNA helicase PIF1
MQLSEDQQIVFDRVIGAVKNRESKKFFLTGKAGTGKSHLVREIVKQFGRGEVGLLAPTGLSAINIGGVTIHRFGCIHYKRNTISEKYFDENMEGKKLIIIDEISMVTKTIYDLIVPFMEAYGVVILFVGDFLQLQPIDDDYSFESEWWDDVTPFDLTINHRQKDKEYLDVLEDIRYGNLTDRVKSFVDKRTLSAPSDVIKLSPYRKEVDRINWKRLKATKETIMESVAEVTFKADFVDENQMFKTARVPEFLDYSKGCRVIMLTNDANHQWANGTLGTIIDVEKSHVKIKFDGRETVRVGRAEHQVHDADGNIIFAYTQFPLALGFAITIHKAQGCSLEKVSVSLSGHFSGGMSYVALSRCVCPDTLYLQGELELRKPNQIALDFVNSGYKKEKKIKQKVFVFEEGVPF